MIGSILREIAGWLLVLIGLIVFLLSGMLLYAGWILTAPPVAFIGFIVFRGGIHVLKVSVASRISYRAQNELLETAKRPARKK